MLINKAIREQQKYKMSSILHFQQIIHLASVVAFPALGLNNTSCLLLPLLCLWRGLFDSIPCWHNTGQGHIFITFTTFLLPADWSLCLQGPFLEGRKDSVPSSKNIFFKKIK